MSCYRLVIGALLVKTVMTDQECMNWECLRAYPLKGGSLRVILKYPG